ncbi:MAG TPA: 2-dehydro-3-deoxy-D-gluconate 5-dehydrogenase KduD [Bacteroidota bacterium]|nr:2-dehydro-3-deoxy-D-gluconate 5-dehydrogenase KduD [Bacteroidota bacterium]
MSSGKLFDLSGKIAVVTGGSTGLGRGMAMGLAESGASIVLVDHRMRKDTAEELRARGHEVMTLTADLSENDAPQEIVNKVLERFKRVDILVNNAGIIRRSAATSFTEKDWDDVLALNAKSVFLLCQAAARDMMKRKKGKIINIASVLSFQGGINVVSYAASKGAVGQMTKALANEWAPEGINVNAIAPGYMVTDNTAKLREDKLRYRQITERIPAGRWGEPKDLEGAVVFLASDASDYVHGHVLLVDGGWTAR